MDGNEKNTPVPKITDPIYKIFTVRRYFLFLSSYVEKMTEPIIPEIIKQPATIEACIGEYWYGAVSELITAAMQV